MSNGWLHRWALAILVVVLFAGAPFVVKVLRPEDGAVPALEALPAGARAPAPDFTLSTLEGRTITLSDLGGQPVLLNFWATWCPPCRGEMPSMERLYREFKGQGLAMLAVDLQEEPERVQAFIAEFGLTFPALLDTDRAVTSQYRVQGLPTTVLVDRSGRIVLTAVGPRNWSSPEAKALMRSLLEEGTASDTPTGDRRLGERR